MKKPCNFWFVNPPRDKTSYIELLTIPAASYVCNEFICTLKPLNGSCYHSARALDSLYFWDNVIQVINATKGLSSTHNKRSMVTCFFYKIKISLDAWELRLGRLQYIPRNMHTVFALRCFVVVIHWLIFPYPSGLLHWHCGNLTIAPVPARQPWWIWMNTSCEFIMNDCITTTKQSTTKPCAYFLGYTVSGDVSITFLGCMHSQTWMMQIFIAESRH